MMRQIVKCCLPCAMKKTGFHTVRKPLTVHSLLFITLVSTYTELLSVIAVLSAWMKTLSHTMWRTTVKLVNGKHWLFPELNLSTDSLCMCHPNALSESDIMVCCVPEVKPSILHYVEIFLAAGNICLGWKIWKQLKYWNHFMESRFLFVNAVEDISETPNNGYLYGFKTQ